MKEGTVREDAVNGIALLWVLILAIIVGWPAVVFTQLWMPGPQVWAIVCGSIFGLCLPVRQRDIDADEQTGR